MPRGRFLLRLDTAGSHERALGSRRATEVNVMAFSLAEPTCRLTAQLAQCDSNVSGQCSRGNRECEVSSARDR